MAFTEIKKNYDGQTRVFRRRYSKSIINQTFCELWLTRLSGTWRRQNAENHRYVDILSAFPLALLHSLHILD